VRVGRQLSTASCSSESLIPTTLKEMDADAELPGRLALGQKRLSLAERKLRRRALDSIGAPDFLPFIEERTGQPGLARDVVKLLQVNVGLVCNQACTHCHVESSPKRTETMSDETVARILALLRNSPAVETVDITGGAPEMNAAFRPLVEGASALGREVIDRCNLTVLCEPGMEWLGPFLAEHRVRVVASLPCYSQRNVDTQRGSKVFERSISGLRELNSLGYGAAGSGLKLDLVYNPGGAALPPDQAALHAAYTEELRAGFGIVFNELFTMTNMPIKRFADLLHKQGKLAEYMQLLVDNFNPRTLDEIMCRSLVSVAHDGAIFDCDFNQALAMPLRRARGAATVWSFESLDELRGAEIATGNHCYGCTAGAGSS